MNSHRTHRAGSSGPVTRSGAVCDGKLRQAAVWAAVLVSAATPALADPPDTTPTNELAGVVVSKTDGKPVAGAEVAMAHSERGWIYVENGGRITAWGDDEKVLLFFSKKNGKTAVTTKTDAEGRFVLRSFTSPEQEYNLAVAHPEHGVAIVEGVVPAEHAVEPLRIGLEAGAFVSLPPMKSANREIRHMATVREATETAFSADGSPIFGEMDRRNIWINAYVDLKSEDSTLVGPLPTGRSYRVSLQGWSRRVGAPATLLERVVRLERPEAVRFDAPAAETAALVGRVTDADGKPLRDVNLTVAIGPRRELVVGALTDEKGEYTLAGVPPGAQTIELSRYAVRTGPG